MVTCILCVTDCERAGERILATEREFSGRRDWSGGGERERVLAVKKEVNLWREKSSSGMNRLAADERDLVAERVTWRWRNKSSDGERGLSLEPVVRRRTREILWR